MEADAQKAFVCLYRLVYQRKLQMALASSTSLGLGLMPSAFQFFQWGYVTTESARSRPKRSAQSVRC